MRFPIRTCGQHSACLACGISLVAIISSVAAEPRAANESGSPIQQPSEVAEESPPDAWPPALDSKRLVGLWLLANGGNERYLMIWLKEDGTFVRGAVYNPWGNVEQIRLEGDVERSSPWKIRRVPRGGYALVMGEAIRQPDGSTVSTVQSLSIDYVDQKTLTLAGGFRGALVDFGSVYKRAKPDAELAIGKLIEK